MSKKFVDVVKLMMRRGRKLDVFDEKVFEEFEKVVNDLFNLIVQQVRGDFVKASTFRISAASKAMLDRVVVALERQTKLMKIKISFFDASFTNARSFCSNLN